MIKFKERKGNDKMTKQQIGVIGLAVMGKNLALNIESRGNSVAVFNRTVSRTEEFLENEAAGKNFFGATSIEEFVNSLEVPRKILLMVQAGAATDATISSLMPYLDKGDILIDGGNTLFEDTNRRNKELSKAGIHFIGTGVSGGEEGALNGPSIMPGGQKEAYDLVAPIFDAIAAKVDGEPCSTYIGPEGAGHYVKMVHNGIEYGDMQLIAEAYAILDHVLGLDAQELHEVFSKWNEGELDSYLIEITAEIFTEVDEDTNQPVVDVILDKAGQIFLTYFSNNAISLGTLPSSTHVPSKLHKILLKYSCLGNERKLLESVTIPMKLLIRPILANDFIWLSMPSIVSLNHQAVPN